MYFAVRGEGLFEAGLFAPIELRRISRAPFSSDRELVFCESVESGHTQHDDAKKIIADRERTEKRQPSNPQIFVGKSMAAKLPKLEADLRSRRSGGTI